MSYFQVMPDAIFARYQARGAQSRDDFILTRAYRDTHPLECRGESFAKNYQGNPTMREEVHLTGYIEPNQ